MLIIAALPGWIALAINIYFASFKAEAATDWTPVVRQDGTKTEAMFMITEDGRVFAYVKPRP